MDILRSADYRRVAWRNGAGETSEIAVFPAGAGADDFDWRISMAPVVADGAFSRFPGVDRVLTVIDGRGLSLALDGGAPALLDGAPFAFAGDVPCRATLGDGPIVDLNVMTRRGRWRAEVRRATAVNAAPGAHSHLIFATDGPLSGRIGDVPFSLALRDTLYLAGSETPALALSGRWLDIQLVPEIPASCG